MDDDTDDSQDYILDTQLVEWEPTYEWSDLNSYPVSVCLGCYEARVPAGHECDGYVLLPQNQDERVVIVSYSDIEELAVRRAKWLNSVAAELVSQVVLSQAVIKVLQDDEPEPEPEEKLLMFSGMVEA